MRTHIRMHIDKKTGDVNEENYISCILDDDSTEIPPLSGINKIPSPPGDNIKKISLRTQPKINNTEKHEAKILASVISST